MNSNILDELNDMIESDDKNEVGLTGLNDLIKEKEKKSKKLSYFDDPYPDPIDIDSNTLEVEKSFMLAVDNRKKELSDDDMIYIEKVLKVLSNAGYKIRFICGSLHKDIDELIFNIFDNDKIYIMKPWKKLCSNVDKDVNTILPSEKNMRAAVGLFTNKFKNLPTTIKYLLASKVTLLFGENNDTIPEMVLIYDRYWDGKKIDFEKSQDSSSYIFMKYKYKDFGLNLINIHDRDRLKDMIKLIKLRVDDNQ